MSRRSILFAVPAGLGLALLSGCAAGPPRPSGSPPPSVAERLRMVGLGFEDLTRGDEHLAHLAERFDDAGANAVSISAGRIDWTAFAWPGRDDAWSSPVADDPDVDLVARAIETVGIAADGTARTVAIVVDVITPRRISDEPELAGVGVEGDRSSDFAGLWSLTRGPIADDLVDFVAAVASRYRPEAVSLTELFLDDTTYGDRDLDDFRERTGSRDWPRTAEGGIDVDAETVVRWRCEAVAHLVARARGACAPHGVELWMEVRTPIDEPAGERRDSGHDYDLLEAAADRLVAWDYFGIGEPDEPSTSELAQAFADRARDRWVMSVGLWDKNDDAISPDELADAVEATIDGGLGDVWVTPASLMTDKHWRALGAAWAR